MTASRFALAVAAATAVLVMPACAADEPDDVAPTASPDDVATATPDDSTTDEVDVDVPETPAGTQTRWALEQLAADDGPTAADAGARFADVFLAQIPADDMAATFDQLRTYGPFEFIGYQGTEVSAQTALRNGSGEPMALEVAVDDAGLITGLFLRQMVEPPDIAAWTDVDAAYAEIPGARVFAADVSDGRCDAVHTFGGSDEPAPLGSTFKLYVLGAVQQAVLDGDVSWDDTVTVASTGRVPTSLDTDSLPDGTALSIADAARSMIAVSDNTATDLLIGLVGRESVEQAVADMGHADPAVMRPLLTTRELFLLGWSDPALRTAWSEADEQGRRDILRSLPDGPPDIDLGAVVDPVHQYGIDWFASGRDICAAHVALQRLAAADDTDVVRDLLTANPGVTLDTDIWPYVAYKGGSAPGELSGSWYVEAADGNGHVLVVQFADDDPAALSDVAYLFGVAGNAIDLFGAN